MDVVILAAGLGSRLGEKTKYIPKSMIELKGRPLLGYSLDSFLSQNQIHRAIVVSGYQREHVMSYLETRNDSKPVLEIWNPDFRSGNLYSLCAALKVVTSEFVLTNADHIFPNQLLAKTLESNQPVGAVCDFDRILTPDCMKVELKEGNTHSILKIHKKLQTFQCGYIGMTLVREIGRVDYLSSVERVLAMRDENAYAEMVLQDLATRNAEVHPSVIDASGFGWLEIDTQEDFAHAEKTLAACPDFLISGNR